MTLALIALIAVTIVAATLLFDDLLTQPSDEDIRKLAREAERRRLHDLAQRIRDIDEDHPCT